MCFMKVKNMLTGVFNCVDKFNTIKTDKYRSFSKTWIKYFFMLAKTVATKSKDPSTHVGCVCVDIKSKRILTTSYNGFPSGVKETPDRWERPQKYARVVHAEANCISTGARFGIRLDNAAVFVTHPPCVDCTKLLISSGIKQIYFLDLDSNGPKRDWHADLEIAKSMCTEAKVSIITFTEEELVDEEVPPKF